MKSYSSVPAFLWYAPAMAGLSYLLVFIFFVLFAGIPAFHVTGDIIFNIGQLAIICSMLLMHKLNLNGKSRWKKFSLFIPVLCALSYMAGFFSGFAGERIILFYPLGALLTAMGMVIVGIQVARARVLKQWKRFAPLAVGLYPFVVMFPIVIITGSPSIAAILLWGFPWIIMGCALLSEYYSLKKSVIV